MAPWLGSARAGFTALALVLASLTTVVSPAHAAIVVSGCNAFPSATPLGAAYHDGDVSVAACGPRPAYGGTRTSVYAYPGALPNPGYQCVEFVVRYLYAKFGVTMNISTNGDQAVDHYVARYPKLFVAVKNGTLNQAPVQGDVISFSQSSNFHSPSNGHAAVVQSSSVDVNGNGTVTVVEENWAANGTRVITMSNWTMQLSGFPYIKWMHAPSLANGPLTTSPIGTDAPSGLYTNVTIRHLLTLTNNSANSISAASVVIGVRDPSGATTAEPCASNINLDTGEVVSCAGSRKWTMAGSYQMWVQWQDQKGNWYSGQLGAVTSFVLAAGRVPTAPATVAALVNSGGVQVQWAAPYSTGGPALTGYVVTTTPATARSVLPPNVSTMTLAGLRPTVTYTVSVRAMNAIGPSVSTDAVLEGSVLSLVPRPAPVNYNDTVSLRGTLVSAAGAARAGAPVTISSSTDGATWTPVTQVQTADDGSFSYAVVPLQATSYRADWAGTDAFRPVSSAAATVSVRPLVTLSLLHSSSRKQHPVYFSGHFTPATPGLQLQVQRLVGKKWSTIAQVMTTADGSYSGRWIPRQPGTYDLRVVRLATATLGAGYAAVRTVKVVR